MSTAKRLFDLLPQLAEKYQDAPVLAHKIEKEWKPWSAQAFQESIDLLSAALLKQGVQAGDHVAIVAHNSPEWNIMDFALQQIGAISVPIYPTIGAKDYIFIFEEAQVQFVFAGNEELAHKVNEAMAGVPHEMQLFTFDKISAYSHWSTLWEGADLSTYFPTIEERKQSVSPEDTVTLIYTSGTTGLPKGVMLSHENILSNALAVADIFPPIEKRWRSLSFLPICHIFERTSIYFYLLSGISVHYAQSIDTISQDLQEVKPQMFTTVPRLLEKVYDKIMAKGHELSGIKRSLFFWAMEVGNRYHLQQDQGLFYKIKIALARKLIFSKWREALGNEIVIIASGGAALQPRLATIFWAAGVRVLEAYGLTETSPGVTFNRFEQEHVRIGTVGPTLKDIQIKIAEDGEVLVKGPNVMKGYYKRPELTADVIDKEGWFHTGDIGTLVEKKYLKITDRKKEMFKTSGGKYIAPQILENKLKESFLIDQVMVIGEGKRFPAALIVPNRESLEEWAHKHGVEAKDYNTLLKEVAVREKMQVEVEKANSEFGHWEKVKRFVLLPDYWTPENGELTAKLSLKRKIILEKYAAEWQPLYEASSPSVEGN